MSDTTVHRQVHCLWCGRELRHQATGRPRETCSTRCRVALNRARKQYAIACVDAALAGEPEPARDFGYPIEIRHYDVTKLSGSAGCAVTKHVRPGGDE